MATRQLVDCKPPPLSVVDTTVAVYADSDTGTGNGRSTACPEDVREMHKYYWELQGRPTVGKDLLPADQLPPELRHDDYSPATGSARLPSKLMSYGLPICGDPAAAKMLTTVAPADYYQTSAGYMAHGDYVGYGYGRSAPDMASMMYHQQTPAAYTSSPAAAQFSDVKAANSAELYQWVREQQNFANAANALGITIAFIYCIAPQICVFCIFLLHDVKS